MKKIKLTAEQEAFVRQHFDSKTTQWIAKELDLSLWVICEKVRWLKSHSTIKPTYTIQEMQEQMANMQAELLHLKGKAWDELLNRINNLSVDIDLKRRQAAYKLSKTQFGDELPTYKIPNY